MKKNQYLLFFTLFFIFGYFLSYFVVQAVITSYVSINKSAYSTQERMVLLYLQGPENVRYMKVSNDVDFDDINWEPFQTQKTWWLDYGNGTKTVYVRFKDSKGVISPIYQDTIQFSPPVSMDVDFFINQDSEHKYGNSSTDSREVLLTIKYSSGVEDFRVSNDVNFLGASDFIRVTDKFTWQLSPGSGEKTVYVQFHDANDKYKTISRKITYSRPDSYIPEGSLVKGNNSTVYYFGYDGYLHPFSHSVVYHSWYPDFSNIRYVSDTRLSQYPVGQQVCLRPGTWLVKFKTGTKVYAVEPGCGLRPLRSEAEAFLIYGKDWSKRVLVFDDVFQSGYRVNSWSVADKDKDIIDRDADGVSAELEKQYGTSDTNSDSDKDKLSDYEEIYYWFTDPSLADSDKDGTKDGDEILTGNLPAGPGKIDHLAVNTYSYPQGTIAKAVDNKFYYRGFDGLYYYAGLTVTDTLLRSNRVDSRFVVFSPFPIYFQSDRNRKITSSHKELLRPTKIMNSSLVDL